MKRVIYTLLAVCVTAALAACSGESYDSTLDFRSVRDLQTGLVLSLGDPRERFDEAFSEIGSDSRTPGHSRVWFRDANGRSTLMVHFWEGEAVSMSTGLSGGGYVDLDLLEFGLIPAGSTLDDFPLDPTRDDYRHARLYLDLDGNPIEAEFWPKEGFVFPEGVQPEYMLILLTDHPNRGNYIRAITLTEVRWGENDVYYGQYLLWFLN